MNSIPTVLIVDDDPSVRTSLISLCEADGLRVEAFANGEELLRAPLAEPTCIVLDVRMPGVDGLELHRRLCEQEGAPPVIFLTAHADVPMAVQAMQAGALGFFEKPCDGRELIQMVRRGIALDAERRAARQARIQVLERLARLTAREREVLDLMVAGLATKEIAKKLGSSFFTVQNQRASILKKMEADSAVDVVRLVLANRDP
ncbi:MAG TPA: response regulator [Planctomycetaceae bacterium]|jgi:FixJ family two-component response regulator|nr:response regulator [Planctomycetaceae bacterium]